ncbi:MAG TPA: choice-of-anchor D domain-containing protein, partial [Terriglobales bacterium]|nr:choice-of-anchor D domain-containing protein [Terriglobales bacterium]
MGRRSVLGLLGIPFFLSLCFVLPGALFAAPSAAASSAPASEVSSTPASSVLSFARYVGAGGDRVYALAVDSSGNSYLTGTSSGRIFVTKISSDGNTVLYYTPLGTSTYNATPWAIAVDPNGNAYITGYEYGGSFPTTPNAYQTTSSGGSYHAFVAVLDPTGANLLYSSYLQGSSTDYGFAVAVDGSGNAYVAGETYSADFPNTTGTAFRGSYDAFIAKINPSLSGNASLVYSTLIPGANTSYFNSLAVDSTGAAYATGYGDSGYPVGAGSFQYNGYSASSGGVYVTKISADGASQIYSAYLGPGQGYGIAVDGSGNAYVTGEPTAADFPTTAGAFQTAFPSGFLVKLSADGSSLVYATFLSGPSQQVYPRSAALQPGCTSCAAYVAGWTPADDYPTLDPVQGFNAGSNDAFITEFAGDGSAQAFSSYLGGSNSDSDGSSYTPAVGVDAGGNIYVEFFTYSTDFPLTIPSATSYSVLAKISPINASLPLAVPTSLTFYQEAVGVTSPPLALTLRNMGSAIANISNITVTGDFAQTNDCNGAIAGGGFCSFSVTFTPTQSGTRTGTLTIATDAASSPTLVNLSGTGYDAAVLQLKPTSLYFGNQGIGTTSSAQTVTVSNIGNQILTLTNIYFPSATDFAQTNNCPSQISPGGSCTISIAFSPTAIGPSSAYLYVIGSGVVYANQYYVSLAGEGVGAGNAALILNPPNLNFPDQPTGTTSAAQLSYVWNQGTVPIVISSATISGDFALLANSCNGVTLNPGQYCYVYVTFTPTAAGARTGSVTINDNSPGAPHAIALAGSGGATVASLSVSPTSLTFPDTVVGFSTANDGWGYAYLVLSNNGTLPVSVTRIAESGDFHVNGSCIGTISPNSYCTVPASFAPTAVGARTGSFTIYSSAGQSPQVVTASGNGLAMTESLVAGSSSVQFPDTVVGTTYNYQSIYFYNTGNTSISISNVAVTGDFAIYSNGCPYGVTAGSYCVVYLGFTPTAAGLRTGTLSLTSSAANSPTVVSLSGNGLVPSNEIVAGASAMQFPDQPVGSTSGYQLVYFYNPGNNDISLTGATVSGDFAIYSNGCSSTIPAGSQCYIYVTFTPTATGARTGTLTLTSSAANSPTVVNLSGNGLSPSDAVIAGASSMQFPDQVVGTTSTYQLIYFYNPGNTGVSITGATTSGDFAIYSNACTTSIAAGGQCYIYLTFTPTAPGARTGTLTLTSSATNSPTVVNLSGNGLTSTEGVIVTGNVDFPDQVVGTTSAAQLVFFYNPGNTKVTITSLTASGDFAISSNGCGTTISAGGYCYAYVTFTPTVAGARTGSITMVDDAPGSPHGANLSGNGLAASQTLVLIPASMDFGSETVGIKTPQLQWAYLRNTGTQTITLSSIVPSGDFSITSNGCGSSLAPAASCYLLLSFTPTATGPRNGAITVTDSAGGSPHILNLTGTGSATQPAVILSPAALAYDQTIVGMTNSPGSPGYIYFYNNSGATVTISNVAAGGDFAVASNGCSTVSNGSVCSVYVTFTPAAAGTRTGTLTFTDTASGSPHVANLVGYAVAPATTFELTDTSISFPDTPIGQTANQNDYTYVYNTGNVSVTISNVAITGDFAFYYNGCTATISPRSYCYFYVQFAPTAVGARTGSITFTDTATGSPHMVSLSGNGVAATKTLSFTDTAIGFPDTPLGQTANENTYTYVYNTGNVPVTISNVAISGDFAFYYNGCTTSIAPKSYCYFYVQFTPTAVGPRTGSVTFTDTATGSPHVVSLSGNGVAPTQTLSFTDTAIGFPDTPVGQTAYQNQYTYVYNTGNVPVTISNVAISGDFAFYYNGCTTSISPKSYCYFYVQFTPTAVGPRTGSITFTDTATGSPHVVSLSGSGLTVTRTLSLTSTALGFPDTPVGLTANENQYTYVYNTGNVAVTISNVAITGDFALNYNGCTTTIAPKSYCLFYVQFTPTATGTRTGAVTLTGNATGSPHVVALSGNGL